MRFRVPTRSPFLSALADSRFLPLRELDAPQGFVPCDLKHFALSTYIVWTISPLLLLPELVEPGFGCLIPSGFFLRETGSSQDQFRLYRPMDFISKMYWIHACLKTVRKKWMPISPALWSHVLVTISGFVWKPGTGTIIFPWNGHLGAH